MDKCFEVVPELLAEGFGCGVAKLSGSGVKRCDGSGLVVSLEEEAVERTKTQAVGIVAEAEADVEAVIQELLQLLGLAVEAVPNPRLCGATLQAQDIIESTDAMEDEGTTELFAQCNLRFKSGKLEVVGRSTDAVETTLADESLATLLLCFEACEALFPILFDIPRMEPEGRYGALVCGQWMVGMEVEVNHRMYDVRLLAVQGEGEGNLGGLLGCGHRYFHVVEKHGSGAYDGEAGTAVLVGCEGLLLSGEGADVA